MRCVTPCVVLCALALPAAAFGAYELQFNPLAEDFSFFREVDPGGGGNTYVVDHLRATFAVPAVPVEANTYRFHFEFSTGALLEYSPDIDRIDFMASLGQIQTNFGVHSSPGTNQSSLIANIENLSVTSLTGDTVKFYSAGSFTDVVGVGVNERVGVNAFTVTPGAPFRLRSLDVTFRIPSQFIPSGAPDSPARSVVLDIGAGDNVRSADVSALEPIVRVVPEPGHCAMLLAAVLTLPGRYFRRR